MTWWLRHLHTCSALVYIGSDVFEDEACFILSQFSESHKNKMHNIFDAQPELIVQDAVDAQREKDVQDVQDAQA